MLQSFLAKLHETNFRKSTKRLLLLSQCGKNGISIGWGRYCKVMAPATLLVIAVSLGILYLRYL